MFISLIENTSILNFVSCLSSRISSCPYPNMPQICLKILFTMLQCQSTTLLMTAHYYLVQISFMHLCFTNAAYEYYKNIWILTHFMCVLVCACGDETSKCWILWKDDCQAFEGNNWKSWRHFCVYFIYYCHYIVPLQTFANRALPGLESVISPLVAMCCLGTVLCSIFVSPR